MNCREIFLLLLDHFQLILVSVLSVSLYLYLRRWNRVREITSNIPGPPSQPYTGNTAIFDMTESFADVNHVIHRLFDKYGPIFKLWNIHELWICICDSQLAKEITQYWKSYEAVPSFNYFSYSKLNFYITNTNCPVRQEYFDVMTTPTLNPESVQEANEKLVKDLKSAAESRTLSPEVLKANVVTSIKEILKKTDWKVDVREEYKNRIYLPVQDRLDLLLWKTILASFKQLAVLMSYHMDASEKVKNIQISTVSFKNEEKMEKCPESTLSVNDLKLDFVVHRLRHMNSPIADYVTSHLSEIIDETGLFLVTLLQEVAAQPEILKKLREDAEAARAANGGRPVTLVQERKLTYTEMVLKEGLRLYSRPGLFYRTGKEITKDSMTVPIDSLVYICAEHIHLNPDHFEKPITFYPEHFTHEKSKNRNDGAYFPLNLNLPQCSDDRFGLKLLKFTLSTIVTNFKIETTIQPEMIERGYFPMRKNFKSINLNMNSL